jgi:hypothetical protein
LRRVTEMLLLRDGEEIAELPKFHACCPPWEGGMPPTPMSLACRVRFR